MSFSDFNNLIDKMNEDLKPKKFISKRIQDKKNISEPNLYNSELNATVNKRKFNPRLPPYFHVNGLKSSF